MEQEKNKTEKGLAHLGASENDRKTSKKLKKIINELKIYIIRLKFCEFLH